jgi:hypothetical protein
MHTNEFLARRERHFRKYLASGTLCHVASPKVVAWVANALALLRAGVYNQKVRQDKPGNINPAVRFI